ncbi:MAG TPA: orotidine-5'-phosphate decarboxylase [Roseateles sp.]|nr:orotidine-5'-phosphate decarboxylase [Roseateles sp.]
MTAPVIVALDFETAAGALALARRLGPDADHYKVGLQLLTAAGPELVRALQHLGKQVFLDLKLHEIPSTVAGAVAAAGRLGVTAVTVHASAGSAVLRAAADAARPFPQLKVLALTVITSLADKDLPEIGLAPSVEEQVMRLAALAGRSGCHGVVASAQEAAYLSRTLPADSLIVCPGVQLPDPASSPAGFTDQARIATPQAAARAGATHIIVGRAITAATDPAAAFRTALSAYRAAA